MTEPQRGTSDELAVRRSMCDSDVAGRLSQAAIEAISEAVLVIDTEYRILYANRAARALRGKDEAVPRGLTCYQMSHHRDSPCDEGECACPLREVLTRNATVTVLHTHQAANGRELFVEVTASPIVDKAGNVVQIVEMCRDITERRRTRRLLEIANRHTEMGPLLREFVDELRQFTGCEAVGIRIRDDDGMIPYRESVGFSYEFCETESCVSVMTDQCLCVSVVLGKLSKSLASCTQGGSFHTPNMTRLLASVSMKQIGPIRGVCHAFGYESVGLIPIRVGEEVLGLIHVADRRQDALSEDMVESLERAAMQLGTSIRRVRAESDLRRAHDELEARVEARTAQLTEANRKLEEEMGQRNRLEREILHVASEEQQRIGRELHDGIGQELTGLGYLAKSLHNRLRDRNSPEAATAAELARGLPQTVMQIQAIVKGLLPLELGPEDLTPALQDLLAGMEERTGIVCRLEGQLGSSLGDKQTAVQLYRIAQEAVTNAVKHGRPKRIFVNLRKEPDRLVLEIRDDGQGTPPGSEQAVGSGLRIMNHRARAIGGVIETASPAGGGSLVRCVLHRESSHDD